MGKKVWGVIVQAIVALLLPLNALAFNLAFSPSVITVPLGPSGANQLFDVVIQVFHPQGIMDPATGYRDLVFVFNGSDITSYFLSGLSVENNSQSVVFDSARLRLAVPANVLTEGIYFLSFGVRDSANGTSYATARLVVGSPTIVSATPNDSAGLRALVENPANKYIYVPTGQYNIGDGTVLRLRDRQVLFGDGPASSIVTGWGIATAGLSPILVQGNGAVIANLGVVENPQGSGISLDGAVSALVVGVNSSTHVGGGAVAFDGAALRVVASQFQTNSYDGITAGNGGSASVILSSSHHNTFDGFGAELGGRLTLDFSESYSNSGVGAGLFSSSTGAFTRNTITMNSKAGLYFGPGTAAANVVSNAIIGNAADGIGILGPGTAINAITGNYVASNQSGLTANTSAKVGILLNNTLIGNATANLSILAGSQVNSNGNSISSANICVGVDGIGSSWISANDTILRAGNLGVLLQNSSAAQLTGTSSTYNNGGGISVSTGSSLLAKSVAVSQNGTFGIGADNPGSNATIMTSVARNNGDVGLLVFTSHGASMQVDRSTLAASIGNAHGNYVQF